MIDKKTMLAAGAGASLVLMMGAGALTFAATGTGTPNPQPAKSGVAGTVTAVNGNTVTITGRDGSTYTIDASGASITKDETVNVSDIAVGDTVAAQGSVSGQSVTASSIHDGKLPAIGMGFAFRGHPHMGLRGTVESISGNTLAVSVNNPTTLTSQTYTVDASNAQVLMGDGSGKPTQGSVSSIKTGDTVMVAGPTSGTSVTAKVIFDGPLPAKLWGNPASSTTSTQ